MSQVSQLDSIVYSILPMPIDICNIILSYKTQAKQISDHPHGMSLYYKCEDILIECSGRDVAVCIINNDVYIFRVYGHNNLLHVFYNDVCIKTFNMPLDIYTIKYSTYLVCEYEGLIVLYDVTTTNDDIILTELHRITNISDFVTLLYTDTNYIIINNAYLEQTDSPTGLTIYNNNFELIKYISTISTVRCVAYYDSVLSYSVVGDGPEAWRTGTWHAIN